MNEFFNSWSGAAFDLNHWAWLTIGLLLLVAELLVPATFFLWLGVAALVTAGCVFFIDGLAWQTQCLIFAALAVAAVLLSRRYLVKRQTGGAYPHLNQRGRQYIGRVFTLTESIQNGVGKIAVDDSQWQVRGPELPRGAKVKAVESDGGVLVVEKFDG